MRQQNISLTPVQMDLFTEYRQAGLSKKVIAEKIGVTLSKLKQNVVLINKIGNCNETFDWKKHGKLFNYYGNDFR